MPKKRKPSYLLHRPSGQARCRIVGRDHYLGEYGSDESKQRYEQIVSDWLGGQDPKRSLLSPLTTSHFHFAIGARNTTAGRTEPPAANSKTCEMHWNRELPSASSVGRQTWKRG